MQHDQDLGRKANTRIPRVLVLAGPSGSGKTSVVSALADEFVVYLERAHENPFLATLFIRPDEFRADLSQEWFISQMEEFLATTHATESIALDQAPGAIVKVYAKMFLEQGLLTEEVYSSFGSRLACVETRLLAWQHPPVVIYLRASAETLRKRVAIRDSFAAAPTWFQEIVFRFDSLFIGQNGVSIIDSEGRSLESVVSAVRELTSAHDSQASHDLSPG